MRQTLMEKEALEGHAVVARQLSRNQTVIESICDQLPLDTMKMVVTCARGSSDHAATYAKYLFEVMLGIPVSSIGPSIGSVYNRQMNLKDSLFLVISQSGKSPDLIRCAEWAKENGAHVVGFINGENTPIHAVADTVVPLQAGAEISVAATKSYIASLAAAAMLVAAYSGDESFKEDLLLLPQKLEKALGLKWSKAAKEMAKHETLLVVGRGLSYGVALEAALKFKETSGIHAEGFSSAELMHGPLALIREHFPVLVFSQEDETRQMVQDTISSLSAKGAKIYIAAKEEGKEEEKEQYRLPIVDDFHPFLQPVTMIQQFYLLVNRISLLRGYDPDRPVHLNKVTETE